MDTRVFFKRIWQINGLLILLVGLLTVGGLLWTGYQVGKDFFRPRTVLSVVNVDQTASVQQHWTMAALRPVAGSDYLIIPLTSDQRYAQSYYDKSASSYRNLLFVNRHTQQQHWLFAHNNWLIDQYVVLTTEQQPKVPLGILYQLIKTDSDQDKRLTTKDSITLAISDFSGAGYRELFPAIDQLLGQYVADQQTLILFYKMNAHYYVSQIALADFTIYYTRQLLDFPEQAAAH